MRQSRQIDIKSVHPARQFLLILILVLFTSCSPASRIQQISDADIGQTGVGGTVHKEDGTTAAGAFVYAYRSAKNGLRGPADFGARVDRSGHYFLDLVEGQYHLVARMRQSGADAGPPRPGDAWSIYQRNPILVEKDQVVTIDFTLQGGSAPRQVRQGSLTTGDTGFRGQLVDVAGNPYPGAFALVYRSADFHRMPDFTSAPADENGRFTLFVPEPGIYCLAARTKTRGQPRVGEPYGTLGVQHEACRETSDGEIVDVGQIQLLPYR